MKNLIITVSAILFSATALAGSVTITNTFTANTAAKASEVNQNFTDIKTAVDDNDQRITTNASGISTNVGNITSNALSVSTNAGNIAGNDSTITTNSGNITGNTSAISNNAGNITNNASAISTNSTAITTNGNNISGNTAEIGKNTGNIATNASDISANTSDIASNAAAISAITGGGSANNLSLVLTGSVTVTAASTLVTGTGTLFTTELAVGDAIQIAGEVHTVASITSDTELQLDAVHSAGALDDSIFTDPDLLNIKNGADQNALVIDKSGNADLDGYLIRKISRATGSNQSDSTDVGQIVTRVLTIEKIRSDTALRIGYTDNFTANGIIETGNCSWEIKVNGASCSGGALTFPLIAPSSRVILLSNSVFGYCGGLTAGNHEVQVWVSGAGCSLGSQPWFIEAEEVY